MVFAFDSLGPWRWGARFPLQLDTRLVIGSGHSADVRIDDDPQVADKHALVEVSESSVIVTDASCGKGTIVNGKLVHVAQLSLGDWVRIGQATLRLVDASRPFEDLPPERSSVSPPEFGDARSVKADGSICICPSCGVIVLDTDAACSSCEEKLQAPLVLHDHAEGFWSSLEGEFTCSACGFASPLNSLTPRGEVQCLRCGLDVKFDPQQWWDALEIAHATADLCGPSREGRFPRPGKTVDVPGNDYNLVGLRRTHVTLGGGSNHISMRASPGHPLCGTCRQPLSVTSSGGRGLTTVCPGCRETHSYTRPVEIPPKLVALGGVLDREHEIGGHPAALQESSKGELSLRCPNCAAELKFDRESALVDCLYCKTTVRLPTHTLAARGDRAPQRLRWWLYFTDVSAARKSLELVAAPARQPAPAVVEAERGDDSASQLAAWLVPLAMIALALIGMRCGLN